MTIILSSSSRQDAPSNVDDINPDNKYSSSSHSDNNSRDLESPNGVLGQGLLTGKLKYTLPGQRFKAAKNVIRKAVFCIDNVHPSVELDDLRLFVTGLSVLTC